MPAPRSNPDPSPAPAPGLSRRERQIVDILYARGRATAREVLEALPDPPSYSAVRALLRLLEEKGHVRHLEQGRAFVFEPTVPRDQARRSALRRLVHTFFGGSVSQAVATLIESEKAKLTPDECRRLESLIAQARSRKPAKEEQS